MARANLPAYLQTIPFLCRASSIWSDSTR